MKYIDLRKKIKSPLFSLQDLRLAGAKVFSYQLSFWQRQGLLLKIRNGLYLFADQISLILPEEVASRIYSPSYISLEKALSAYGIIPEMTYAITSVTPKITRTFKNRLGTFVYRHIKPSLFFGYREIKEGSQKYLRAELEKAFLDFIYFNLRKIKTKQDIAAFRFNQKILKEEISRKKIIKYLKSFRNRRMSIVVRMILGIG